MNRNGIKHPSMVIFYFFYSKTSNELIKKEIPWTDYNKYLMNNGTSQMDVNYFDIDKEELVVKYKIDNKKNY